MRITVLLLIATLASCSWFTSEAKKAETALIDCGKTNLLQDGITAGATLLADVASLLAGSKPDYKSQLDILEAKVGPDALACAAKAAVAVFGATTAKGVETDPAVARGNAYIAAKGYRFAGAP